VDQVLTQAGHVDDCLDAYFRCPSGLTCENADAMIRTTLVMLVFNVQFSSASRRQAFRLSRLIEAIFVVPP
jgi:hypothetical protein